MHLEFLTSPLKVTDKSLLHLNHDNVGKTTQMEHKQTWTAAKFLFRNGIEQKFVRSL